MKTTAVLNILDRFTRAYLECALWASTDNADESGGEQLDVNYTLEDISEETLKRAIEDCVSFQDDNEADLSLCAERGIMDAARAGHNFWLNRNGHGSGFWDEYFGEDKELRAACVRLSEASKVWGSIDPYVGDDGLIYFS